MRKLWPKLIHEDRVLAIADLGVGMERATEAIKPTCADVGVTLLSQGTTFKLLELPAKWTFTFAPHHAWSVAPFYAFCNNDILLTKVGSARKSLGVAGEM